MLPAAKDGGLEADESSAVLREEERRLLGSDGTSSAWTNGRDKPQWRHDGRRGWALLAGAALMVLILVVGFLLNPTITKSTGIADVKDIDTSKDKPAISLPPEIRSNSYLLEANWDHNAPTQRREYWWTVRDLDHNPDGVYRPMILVNHQFPGPLIEVNEGDTIVVHVRNKAINATSIHWHGLYQNGTPHMDGTVGVTQCAIAPGSSYTYEFAVKGQSGTYWWHAHQGLQASDGLHGPLIIHGRREKELQQLSYATDRIILLSDHYHDLSSALLWQYLKPDMENSEPVPVGALINGRSIRNCDEFPERKCDNTTGYVGRPVFDLKPGLSHRIRFINVGAFAEFQVQIDEHRLAVTEVDGTDVVPAYYHRIHINPAQRYSVIISADHSGASNFWLRARMIKQCFVDPPRTLEPEVRAIVNYEQEANIADNEPSSMDWDDMTWLQCQDMNATELVPVESMAAPATADAFFYLRANFEIGAYRLSRGFFNHSSWRANPHSPTLIRAVDGLASGNTSFTSSAEKSVAFVNDVAFDASHELVIQTTGVTTIDLFIHNFEDKTHPFHLHGYKFFVLAQGHGYPPLTEVGADITTEHLSPLYDNLDLSNPLRRDTASVLGYSWMLLRVVADNPGVWAFHCHISWHSEAGLMMQLMTRADELGALEMPKAHLDLCAASGLEKGMPPKDEDYRELAMQAIGDQNG